MLRSVLLKIPALQFRGGKNPQLKKNYLHLIYDANIGVSFYCNWMRLTVCDLNCTVEIDFAHVNLLIFQYTLIAYWISVLLSLLLCVQVIECLKDNKGHLSQRCHQKIFKLQETEMIDPELDFQLMRVCKQMIRVSDHGKIKKYIIWLQTALENVVQYSMVTCALVIAAFLLRSRCQEHAPVPETKQEQRTHGS